MKFRYRKIPDDTNPKGYINLPLLQVRLFYESRYKDVMALIDTGADDCMFHSSVASALGIELTSGKPKPFTGIADQVALGYLHQIELQVQGFNERIKLEAAFTEDNHIPLIGQAGFFDNYQVIFERYRGRFEIRSRTFLHALRT